MRKLRLDFIVKKLTEQEALDWFKEKETKEDAMFGHHVKNVLGIKRKALNKPKLVNREAYLQSMAEDSVESGSSTAFASDSDSDSDRDNMKSRMKRASKKANRR